MPDDEMATRRLRREVEGAIHEMFEDELASRVHFCGSEVGRAQSHH